VKLMIADDQMSLHTFLDKMMDWPSLGITDVMHVFNGEEAANLAAAYKPDLLLIDIRMPVLDGLGALKLLQLLGKKPKSVILSAYNEFEYARDALRLHVSQYLLKPVDTRLLENVIKELVQEIRSETQLRITSCLEKAELRIPLSNTELIMLEDCFRIMGIVQYALWTFISNMPGSLLDMRVWMSCTGMEGQLVIFESAQSNGKKFFCMGMKEAYTQEDLRELSVLMLKKWKESEPDRTIAIGFSGIETAVDKLSQTITDSEEAAHYQSGTSKLEHIVRKIKEHVESCLNEDLSLQAVAERFQIDKYQISRVFKQEFNINYWAFVTKIRMEKAAHFLKQTSWKNNSIAERIGFLDESHFSRAFKKYYGVTPKDYRSSRIEGKDT
jgi:two-component system, response regulator YesN